MTPSGLHSPGHKGNRGGLPSSSSDGLSARPASANAGLLAERQSRTSQIWPDSWHPWQDDPQPEHLENPSGNMYKVRKENPQINHFKMWLHTIKNFAFYFTTLVDDPKCPADDKAYVVHRWKINPGGSIPQSSFLGFMVNSRAFKSISIMSSWYFKVQWELQTSLWRLSDEFYLQSEHTFPRWGKLRGYNWLRSTLLYGDCMGWMYSDWNDIDKNIFQK